MNTKLRMKFNEYVETWSSLLQDCYSRGLGESIIDLLKPDDDGFVKYSMELALVTLFVGLRIWMKSKISQDVKEMVRDAVADSFYREIFNSKNDAEFITGCRNFFNERYNTLSELCPNLGGKSEEKQRSELIGMARYICAQVSDKPEEQNTPVFEKLGLVLIDTVHLSQLLTLNSSLDIQFPIGKPKFIVQK